MRTFTLETTKICIWTVFGFIWILLRASSNTVCAQGTPLPKPGRIDLEARRNIDQMISEYRRMKTFSATAYIQGKIGQTPSYIVEKQTQVWFQKPNLLAVKEITTHTTSATAVDRSESIVAMYDGARLLVKTSRHRDQYIRRRTPTNQGLALSFQWGGMVAPGLSILFTRPEEALYNHPLLAPYISLSMGKPDVVAGVPVQTVVWEVDQGEFSKTTATYYIGMKDHLLRRISFTQMFQGRTNTVTESYTNLVIDRNLLPSTFVFIPPRGARPVESFAKK